MIEVYTIITVVVALAAGLFCLGAGLIGRTPSDYTVGASALVLLLLIGQVGIAIAAPFFGNTPVGDGLEYWIYLITAVLLAGAGPIWALVDRSRWSTAILGVVGFTIAVMVYRMQVIWG